MTCFSKGARQGECSGMEECMTTVIVAAVSVIAVTLYHYFVNVHRQPETPSSGRWKRRRL